jgi:hypothetical protein
MLALPPIVLHPRIALRVLWGHVRAAGAVGGAVSTENAPAPVLSRG